MTSPLPEAYVIRQVTDMLEEVVSVYNIGSYDNYTTAKPPTVSVNLSDGDYYKYSGPKVIAIAFAVGVLILSTIAGNVFVIVAILTERSLKTVQNYLILSLAVTDLFVAVLVMPLSLLNEVTVQWMYGGIVCDLWTSMDILCCTASILHLVAISCDRYFAVSNVDYIRKRNERRIGGIIAIVWVVSGLISIAPLFGWRDPNHAPEYTGQCMISQDLGYTVFSTVFAFYLPLFLMIVLNIKIYNIAKSRIRRRRFKPRSEENGQRSSGSMGRTMHRECSTTVAPETADHPIPNNNEITVLASAHESEPSANNSQHSQSDHRHRNSDADGSDHHHRNSDADGSDHHHRNSDADGNTKSPEESDEAVQIKTAAKTVRYAISKSVTFRFIPQTVIENPGPPREQISHREHCSRRERIDMKRERRAAKVLAIITSAFVLCWLPFFLIAVIAPFCQENCYFPGPLISFFLWLGYVNSLVNPVIYTIFNPHFRKAFNKILFVKFLRRSKHLQYR